MSDSLILHKKLNGKISIRSSISLKHRKNLSLAYTPGVGEIVKEIYKNPQSVYDLTIKKHTVAVVTDGSAVLGLGNVGPFAALPVMEGKCAIFKEFAGVDAFPICLNTQDKNQIITTIKSIAPVFGGINLEDIAAPNCFYIEEHLQDLGIPVVHDDQHATAIITLAGLINAIKVVKKDVKKCRIVIVGAGAAGSAVTKLLHTYGCKNLIIVDSQGIISSKRKDLDIYKTHLSILSSLRDLSGSLNDAVKDADILIGVSKKDLFTKQIIQSMNKNPIVFALANPDPEVSPSVAKKYGVKVIATGRSDYPNQINNALVFPGLFKGLLESRITNLTDALKITVARAIANLVKNPTPSMIIPSIFDKRVVPTIVKTVKNTT